MAVSEKQMIPLEAIPQTNADIQEQPSAAKDLLDVKFPSRPRRKVIIIVGVIAVFTVVIIAASLIGKYVPSYLSDANSNSEKGTKDKGIGKPEESILTTSSDKKPFPEATSSNFQQTRTSPLPQMTSLTSAATTSSMGEATSIMSIRSGIRLASSVADVVVIDTDTSSLTTETKLSAKATLSNFHQGQTTSLQRMTSLTSASATSSMNETTSVMSTMSGITLASSVADVAVIAKLVPNRESKWSRWSSWTDCTKTCGSGTRQRKRTCVAIDQKAVFAPISCAGKSQQVKSCAEWSCPDCSKNCTIGTLNAACDACTCAHHSLTGRILTESDVPLSEVNISLAETPYNILTQTNVSGYFSTLGVCADDQQELLITKAGFVPVKQKANVLTPTKATIKTKMEIAVAPFVTVHPESKIRMSGQSVTFCCDGEGNPPPEIEWFKENNVIDKDLYNYDKVLEISDVTALNGSFRCRVVNQFGSEFSAAAELTVFEKSEDSCSSTPKSKNETLPDGCVLNGTNITTVDVGECEPVACVKENSRFNSSCTESSQCCGPRSFERALIQCGSVMSFDLSVVKTCRCGDCIEKQTVIEGTALGQDDSTARLVDLFFAGQMVARTNANGKFSFTVPKTTKRAIVTFKDQIFKKFEEEDKIFILNEGQRVTYQVKLREKLKPITFNASEPLDVRLGGESDSFADLEIPENALLTEDGSVFSGNAKALVSVTDPRNQSDISSAPGDFSTMNEDGEEEILETYGMIKLSLEDENGKPLVMSKPMKVYLDPEKLNLTLSDGNVSVKLYWLDRKTGRWRSVGDFALEDGSKRRRKRSSHRVFLAGTVTPAVAKYNLNFDQPEIKVGLRVTTEPATDGLLVTAIRKDHGGFVERTTTNGVICMPIWKNRKYFLQASKDLKYYEPDSNLLPSLGHVIIDGGIKSIKVTNGITVSSYTFESKNTRPTGPIFYDDGYNGLQRKECEKPLDAAQTKGGQFIFKKPKANQSTKYELLDPSIDMGEWLSQEGETCFIQVKVTGTNSMIMAASYKQKDQTYTGKYGFHVRTSRRSTSGSDKVACLQFRCPRENDYTAVLLTPLITKPGSTCSYKNTSEAIKTAQRKSSCHGADSLLKLEKGEEKWLCIPLIDRPVLGTYMGLVPKNAEARCLRSYQRYQEQDLSLVRVTDISFAVEYNCR